jgi:hypothetical protein
MRNGGAEYSEPTERAGGAVEGKSQAVCIIKLSIVFPKKP